MHAPAALGHGLVFITVPEADQMHDRILRARLPSAQVPRRIFSSAALAMNAERVGPCA